MEIEQKRILIANHFGFFIGNDVPFTLIAGPCVMESEEHAFAMATLLNKIAKDHEIQFVFKTSFDKANRSSRYAKRGVGYEASLPVFQAIRDERIPILTDVHEPWQCAGVAEHVDILQIPAFLCRQTDLIVEAAQTGLIIHLMKKGLTLRPLKNKKTSCFNKHSKRLKVSYKIQKAAFFENH